MLCPTTRLAIIASFQENEAAAKRMFTIPSVEDIRLCVVMAAEEHSVTFEQAREVLIDHWVASPN